MAIELYVETPRLSNLYVFSVCALVLLFVKSIFSPTTKPGKALPTPFSIPWLGPVWDVDGHNIYKTFKAWADRCGPIYEVKLLGQKLIIVSDPHIAKEILAQKAKIASDRPSIGLVDNSKAGGKYLPFLGNNEHLGRQRKFGVSILNYTARQSYHGRLVPETARYLNQLLQQQDNHCILLEQLCRRLSSRMAYGTTVPGSNITYSAHKLMKNLSPAGRVTNTMTFLRYLPTWLHPEKQDEAKRVAVEDRVWRGAFSDAKTAYERGTLRDSYAKYFLDGKSDLTETEAIYGIGMMATVSVITIVAPVQRWLVAMSENPEWQAIVQEELDEKLQGRFADVNDSALLPKLRATIVESVRWASPIPSGIPHRLEADVDYNGYHLSKDSNVLACDWAISRSNANYKDCNTFDPNRYLEPTSSCYREPLTEYPKLQGQTAFGYGRRNCIGENYAAAQILVTCAAIMYGFNLSPAMDRKTGRKVEVSVHNATPHVIPIMDSFDLVFTPRSELQSQRIKEMSTTLHTSDECDVWGSCECRAAL